MKAWITKHALTKGIYEMEVKSMSEGSVYGKAWNEAYHGEGKEWHRTYDSAVATAEEMRKRKITSLKNQIAKLEKMEFTTNA